MESLRYEKQKESNEETREAEIYWKIQINTEKLYLKNSRQTDQSRKKQYNKKMTIKKDEVGRKK